MGPVSLVALLFLAACAPWHRGGMEPGSGADVPDSLAVDPEYEARLQAGLRTARFHLLRAQEATSCSLFAEAQGDLDRAFRVLAALEQSGASPDAEARRISAAVESAYLRLLPHLDSFSPDSPLILLLQGLSAEKIENLLPGSTQLVRIHQLAQRSDMPIDASAKVAASIHFFQTRGRDLYSAWMRRMGRFRPMILEILREEQVPEDLLYLAMIESGFNPNAYSSARAVGLWQFMEETGRDQGLRCTPWIDERRDPAKATRAAARHLRGLYSAFQDWRLALAAYNAGYGRVSRAIERAGVRDFWRLDLPQETENYVPLFMAAAVISKEPEAFGISQVAADPPMAYDEVELPEGTPVVDLKAAAKCLGVSYAELRDLNPELRQRTTPPRGLGSSGYRLHVPAGRGGEFLGLYALLPAAERAGMHEYVVRHSDNLSGIARSFGVHSAVIADANSITNPNRIYPGQVLYIPVTGNAGAIPAAHQKRVYTVRRGDTLSRIAARHHVQVRQMMQWNGLRTPLIRPGDRLVMWSPKTAVASAAHAPAAKVRANAGGPLRHRVQPGETLWALSRTFNVSVAQLKSWNRLGDAVIHPGQQLIVGRAPVVEQERLYTVVRGDTLYGIARRFGLQADEIARQNNITLATELLAGMTLKIRPGSSE